MKAMLQLLCLLMCLQIFAKDTQMYRWRDANNQLHVGQIPPTDYPYETITVSARNDRKSGNANPAATQQPSSEQQSNNCEMVRANLKMLASDQPLYKENKDGSSTLLSETEVAAQKTLAAEQLKIFCLK